MFLFATKVMKIVHAIRMGWIKPSGKKEPEKPNYFLMWNETDDGRKDKKHRMHIPAPRMKLPGKTLIQIDIWCVCISTKIFQ